MDCIEIPEEVQAFLRDHIESYEQLEILLLLWRERVAVWTVEHISARLRIPAPLAAAALASLSASRLVESRDDQPEPGLAYAPATATLDEIVNRLAGAYANKPIEIIKLMSANAIQRVRTAALQAFADAFVLRKGQDDG
jgi:DNA-binding IscR family transcriptional regulator